MYGNPIAKLIVSLKSHENRITLKLPRRVEICKEQPNDDETEIKMITMKRLKKRRW